MWPRPHAIMFKNAKRFPEPRRVCCCRVARKLKLAKINKKQKLQQGEQPEPAEDYKAKSINLTAKEILL